MKTRLVAIALLALALTGCGRVSAGAAPIPSEAPKKVVADLPLDQPMSTGVGMMAGGGAVLGAPVPAGGACEALNGCNVHAQLVVGAVDKKKAGFLWRKLNIKGQVSNRGAAALSGEIMVRFKKKDQVVQSEYIAIANLAPGASQSFEAKSSVAADDVEVTTRAL